MAQSIFAGCTNYSEQTSEDILKDIMFWIKYSQEIKCQFENTIEELRDSGYWNSKVDFDFRLFSESMPQMINTFISDFEIVCESIEQDHILPRDIKILKNIRDVVFENERHCWKTYKSDSAWHDYGNPDFKKVEQLYADGRDYLVTLKDVGNAASRLEDYMRENKVVEVTKTDNSIHIGDKNKIKKVNIGNNNGAEPKQNTGSKFKDIFLIPLIVAVIAAVICAYFNIR